MSRVKQYEINAVVPDLRFEKILMQTRRSIQLELAEDGIFTPGLSGYLLAAII